LTPAEAPVRVSAVSGGIAMRIAWLPAVIGLTGLLFSSPGFAQTAWQDRPAVKQLYEAAKKEGEVVVWGTAATEVDWIAAAFGKLFPGIAVKVLGDNDVATKAVAEHRAGRYEVDVFQTSFTVGRPVLERNLYAKVDWSVFGTPVDNTAFDGRAVLTHNLVYAVVYNKNLVKPEDLPKTWEDLLQDKYKNRMAGSTFLVPRLIGGLGLVWREEKMLQYARGLMQTGILLSRAPTQNLLQSGERHYAFANFVSQSQDWARQGLPVDYVVPTPVIATQLYASVMDKAPHPNAARLMAGYMSTPEGKAARRDFNFAADVRKNSNDPLARQIWSSGAAIVFDQMEDIPLREALIAKVNPIIAGQAR
jgi:iron(III) transport system substrate-binding protein